MNKLEVYKNAVSVLMSEDRNANWDEILVECEYDLDHAYDVLESSLEELVISYNFEDCETYEYVLCELKSNDVVESEDEEVKLEVKYVNDWETCEEWYEVESRIGGYVYETFKCEEESEVVELMTKAMRNAKGVK